MHLGRFHAVITDLVRHLDKANLIETLEEASSAIGSYANNRDESTLKRFRDAISQTKLSATISDPDLMQPFSRQVTEELGLNDLINPELSEKLFRIISESNYDPAGLSEKIKKYSDSLATRIKLLRQMENSLDRLGVEYERVDEGESEIGFMLPREVVGEKLSDLSKEFDQLNKLARAIAEISNDSENYEPKVRTIASSWWQIFLDLSPEQIGIWVIAIERIISLFKSNLEIKNLSSQLREKKMPENITKAIEEEIDKRVKSEIAKIADEIKNQNSKDRDQTRMNELETQLRQGLNFLAKRLNQGMQVEVNLAIPDEPELPQAAEGEEVDAIILRQIEKKKVEIEKLTSLRQRALEMSDQARQIGEDSPILVELDPDVSDT